LLLSFPATFCKQKVAKPACRQAGTSGGFETHFVPLIFIRGD